MNNFLLTSKQDVDFVQVEKELSETAQWIEETMMPRVIEFILQLTLAFVVIIIGMKVIKWVRKILKKSLEKNGAEQGLVQFLDSLVKYILYLILALTILQRFGIQTTSIVAAIGSLGVAIGLALKGSFSNFAGGVIVLLLKPFVVGDYIIQDGMEGTVHEIQLFYTTLLTGDNRKIIIPNGQLADNSLINTTAAKSRRVDIRVGISYSADIKLAKEILLNLGNNEPCALMDEGKKPMAAVEALAESSVNMLLRLWVPTDKFWEVTFRLNEAVKNAFDEAGIEIPYNQLDVHVITKEDK